MSLPCYHTEWFVGAVLTQGSLFAQVCLGIASQSGAHDICKDGIGAFTSVAEAGNCDC